MPQRSNWRSVLQCQKYLWHEYQPGLTSIILEKEDKSDLWRKPQNWIPPVSWRHFLVPVWRSLTPQLSAVLGIPWVGHSLPVNQEHRRLYELTVWESVTSDFADLFQMPVLRWCMAVCKVYKAAVAPSPNLSLCWHPFSTTFNTNNNDFRTIHYHGRQYW